jgi:periplasmic protein TonB
MLDKLLESRARRRRPVTGVVVSVCAHTALIAAAVYATAQARNAPAATDVTRPIYFVPSKDLVTQPSTRANPAADPTRSHERPILRFFDVPTMDVKVPSIDMSSATTNPNDFGASRLATKGPEGFASDVGNGQVFRADQVERQVETKPGNRPPVYPRLLQETGTEGKVIATFVVNEGGFAEDSTVMFVASDNALFGDAVRAALKRMRFIPAEAGGRKVRQLVQMPFVFTLRK